MKKVLTFIGAIALSSTMLFATEPVKNNESIDTLVVIVKHEKCNSFLEKTGRPFKKGYKVIEKSVVDGYKAVENGFIDGYKAVENFFVEPFTDTVSSSINYRKGYRGDVEIFCTLPDTWGITSSHGYSFGNGLYVGGGAGFSAEFTPDYKSNPTYLVPVFADLKYSFLNNLASPFVNLRTGVYADITNPGIRYFINPSVGMDIGRFALKVGYELQAGAWQAVINKHCVKFGVAVTF